ncbi:MAG: DMT family transporter [Deltaproteobacteria bacterium]|nr:DMT family transporter [Deltaproteobacteria bacterium]
MEKRKRNHIISGVLPILTASVLWAVGYFIRKSILYAISPLLLAFFSAFLTCCALWLFYGLNLKLVYNIFSSNPFQYIFLGLTGVVFGSTLMFLSLDYIDLGIATVLEKLQPVFTVILAWYFLNETLTLRQIFYALTMLIGSFFVVLEEPFTVVIGNSNIIGISAVIGAAFFWAISSIIGKNLLIKKIDPHIVTFMRFAIGSIILSPFFIFHRQLHLQLKLNAVIICLIIISSLITTTFGYIIYYKGLRYVTASVAGVLELITPLAGIFLGIIFLGEDLNLIQAIAIAVMFFSVYNISKRRRKRKNKKL